MIYPSDHFVHPEGKFIEEMRSAVRAAERYEDEVVLVGALPDRLELDYGWIQPGAELGTVGGVRSKAFMHFGRSRLPWRRTRQLQPESCGTRRVMVAKVETLWNVGW